MKKNLLFRLSLLAVVVTLVTFSACKKYDDEINSLQAGLDKLTTSLEKMQNEVASGAIITSVENVDNGIVINFSGGKSYKLNRVC